MSEGDGAVTAADIWIEACDLFLAGRAAAAKQALQQLKRDHRNRKWRPWMAVMLPAGPDRQVPPSQPKEWPTWRSDTMRDDEWRCCYCGELVICDDAIELLCRLAGDAVAWTLDRHGRFNRGYPSQGGLTAYGVEAVVPNVEHKIPLCRPKGDYSKGNTRAACTPCNETKSIRLLAECPTLVERPWEPGWDGMTGKVQQLVQLLGSPPRAVLR